MSLNSDLSDLFATLAAIMDIRGENPFKAISFSKTSRMIRDLPQDIKESFDKNTLGDLPGIGPGSKKSSKNSSAPADRPISTKPRRRFRPG